MSRSADDSDGHSDEDTLVEDPVPLRDRYLFPVDGDHSEAVLELVCDLVAAAEAELVIAAPVTVPDQTPLEMPQPRQEGRRRAAQYALKAKQECHSNPSVEQVVKVGHNRAHILQEIIDTYDISTLITEDQPQSGIRSLLGFEGVDKAAVSDDCDTIIVSRIDQLGPIQSILVPIARGPHSGMAIDTALAIAQQHAASLELLHVYDADDDDGRALGEEVLETGIERVGDYEPVERTLREAKEVPKAIIEYTPPFDITVLGAPREGLLRQFILGTVPQEVSTESDGAVLIAHRGGADESWLSRWV